MVSNILDRTRSAILQKGRFKYLTRSNIHPLHYKLNTRSSRPVILMKLIFPATALAIVGLTFAWPQLMPEEGKFRVGESAMRGANIDGLIMENPRYVGVDEKSRPYQVSAMIASQRSKSDNLIYLDAPKADIMISKTEWVALSATKGIYNKIAETVDLSGEVVVFYDKGYEFQSSTIHINLKSGIARSDKPVSGHGMAGEIKAEGFELRRQGKHLFFLGKSRAVLRSAQKGNT